MQVCRDGMIDSAEFEAARGISVKFEFHYQLGGVCVRSLTKRSYGHFEDRPISESIYANSRCRILIASSRIPRTGSEMSVTLLIRNMIRNVTTYGTTCKSRSPGHLLTKYILATWIAW